jgi:hypothetical protein
MGGIAFQAFERLKSVYLRHFDVQQDQIRRKLLHHREHFARGGQSHHPVKTL